MSNNTTINAKIFREIFYSGIFYISILFLWKPQNSYKIINSLKFFYKNSFNLLIVILFFFFVSAQDKNSPTKSGEWVNEK